MLLEIEDLGFRRGEAWVLRHLSLALNPGELLGVVGPSGVGKSTLLRLILGLLEPTEGCVRFEGRPWSGLPESARRAHRPRLQALPQEAKASLPPHRTGARLLQDAAKVFGLPKTTWPPRFTEALEGARFEEAWLSKLPGQLSGGQAQRLALARVLVAKPALLLLDEPFSAQDPLQRRDLVETLGVLREEGTALLVVSHDEGPLRALRAGLLRL